MPLMRNWVEIMVDEELLVPVVRELLVLAEDPNHVEVVHGTHGRTILADVRLADLWYQQRLEREASSTPTPPIVAESKVYTSNFAQSRKDVAQSNTVAKPTKLVKPSASLKGEER